MRIRRKLRVGGAKGKLVIQLCLAPHEIGAVPHKSGCSASGRVERGGLYVAGAEEKADEKRKKRKKEEAEIWRNWRKKRRRNRRKFGRRRDTGRRIYLDIWCFRCGFNSRYLLFFCRRPIPDLFAHRLY